MPRAIWNKRGRAPALPGEASGTTEGRCYTLSVECHVAGDCISMMQASIMDIHQGLLTRISFHRISCVLLVSHHHRSHYHPKTHT